MNDYVFHKSNCFLLYVIDTECSKHYPNIQNEHYILKNKTFLVLNGYVTFTTGEIEYIKLSNLT